jgi:hypothetical protein
VRFTRITCGFFLDTLVPLGLRQWRRNWSLLCIHRILGISVISFPRLRLSEALFGTPDEIGEEEAERLFSEAGLAPEAINDHLCKRLYTEAQQFWMAKKELRPLLKKALEDLRPLSVLPRNESELARQAKADVGAKCREGKAIGISARARLAIRICRVNIGTSKV